MIIARRSLVAAPSQSRVATFWCHRRHGISCRCIPASQLQPCRNNIGSARRPCGGFVSTYILVRRFISDTSTASRLSSAPARTARFLRCLLNRRWTYDGAVVAMANRLSIAL